MNFLVQSTPCVGKMQSNLPGTLKLTFSQLKPWMVGILLVVSFWDLADFQGRTVGFREGSQIIMGVSCVFLLFFHDSWVFLWSLFLLARESWDFVGSKKNGEYLGFWLTVLGYQLTYSVEYVHGTNDWVSICGVWTFQKSDTCSNQSKGHQGIESTVYIMIFNRQYRWL